MNNKFDDYIGSILFSLNGKISKQDFNKIKKHYKWSFDYKKIHIVGTNGKGTNATFINNELIENGYKVGLFTSPHIQVMYERIQINNKPINFEELFKFVSNLKNNFLEIDFGFFDVFFLAAIYWFEKNNVDVAIFEAGIGAKKDVVNYINHDITLITSISIDHQNILGKTEVAIAKDKSYAIKKTNHIYIPNSINKNIIQIFKDTAKRHDNDNIFVVDVNKGNFYLTNQSLSQFVLNKEFQINNFKTNFNLPKGRCEKIMINNIKCYVDVAHNVEGIKESIKYLEYYSINFEQIVLSLSNDKDEKNIVLLLKNKSQNIFVFENNGRKPLKINDYESSTIKIYDLKRWLKNLKKSTLFIGSFYFVGQILKEINENKQHYL